MMQGHSWSTGYGDGGRGLAAVAAIRLAQSAPITDWGTSRTWELATGGVGRLERAAGRAEGSCPGGVWDGTGVAPTKQSRQWAVPITTAAVVVIEAVDSSADKTADDNEAR
jgi:hypothetical protein